MFSVSRGRRGLPSAAQCPGSRGTPLTSLNYAFIFPASLACKFSQQSRAEQHGAKTIARLVPCVAPHSTAQHKLTITRRGSLVVTDVANNCLGQLEGTARRFGSAGKNSAIFRGFARIRRTTLKPASVAEDTDLFARDARRTTMVDFDFSHNYSDGEHIGL